MTATPATKFDDAALAEHVRRVVDKAPRLTREQIDGLRVQLEPARRDLARTGGDAA